MRFVLYLSAVVLLMVTGCSAPTTLDYAQNSPTLDLRKYMNGDVDAWGMFISSSGKADPIFHVKLRGTWKGNVGTLAEHFYFSDGHTQDRVWTLVFSDDHTFTATAPDVVGTASGSQYGNAADLTYILSVTTASGSSYDMSMDDWLYQMNDETVINRNEMRKFGFKAGELIITFHKPLAKTH